MEHRYAPRLPLEYQARLRQVELEAAGLSRDELFRCLMAAWSGWLTERHMTSTLLEDVDLAIDIKLRGCTPAEVCR